MWNHFNHFGNIYTNFFKKEQKNPQNLIHFQGGKISGMSYDLRLMNVVT